MKRVFILLTVAIVMTCASAFGEKTLNIVATTYPQYDWLRNIIGDRADDVNLTLLVNNGSDIHNYQPSAKDIIQISTCDMIVYVGGESDKWVEDVLNSAPSGNIARVSMLERVEARHEELIDGMQEDGHDEHEHAETEYDEHVWLSLRHAQSICRAIAEELSVIDPDNAGVYRENADNYIEKIGVLDGKYASAVESASRKLVLFADRFPFRYMTDDYGIEYYAAFAGCSAETEASFETVAFLAGKLDELNLPVVLVIEGSDRELAQTIISCTRDKNQRVLEMNSIQSVKDTDTSYITIMESNLSVLEEALN